MVLDRKENTQHTSPLNQSLFISSNTNYIVRFLIYCNPQKVI